MKRLILLLLILSNCFANDTIQVKAELICKKISHEEHNKCYYQTSFCLDYRDGLLLCENGSFRYE